MLSNSIMISTRLSFSQTFMVHKDLLVKYLNQIDQNTSLCLCHNCKLRLIMVKSIPNYVFPLMLRVLSTNVILLSPLNYQMFDVINSA